MQKIQYTVNFEAKQKSKLENYLSEYKKVCGYELRGLKIERYWKIKEQFQAIFTIEFQTSGKEQTVYKILSLAQKMKFTEHKSWTVSGPTEHDDLSFACIFNNPTENQPLKWVHIELLN